MYCDTIIYYSIIIIIPKTDAEWEPMDSHPASAKHTYNNIINAAWVGLVQK
jgi:hypothetical protein